MDNYSQIKCFICSNELKNSLNQVNHFYDDHMLAERICITCKKDRNIVKHDMIFNNVCSNCRDKQKCSSCSNMYCKGYIKEHQKTCNGPKDKTIRICRRCQNIKPLYRFFTTYTICKECLSEKVKCEKCEETMVFRYLNHHIQAYHT
jgi:hypothetical protein